MTANGTGPAAIDCPTHGRPGARVLFVGGTPSPVDAALRRPLSGVVGKTFADAYLAPLGLARDDVAITHAVPRVLTKGAGTREPTGPECDAWGAWLKGEIDRIKPTTIVALGNVAKMALRDRADVVCLRHPALIKKLPASEWQEEATRKLRKIAKAIDGKGERVAFDAPIRKLDDEKQIAYCVALAPDEVDLQDDTISAEEIEKTAHRFLAQSRVIGERHEKVAAIEVVESYVAPADFDLAGQTVRKGSWVVGLRFLDAQLWNQAKSGALTGVSIGGRAIRERVAADDPIRRSRA